MSEKFTKFFPLHGRDYRADTAHLNLEQHGAYLLLLIEQWERGSISVDEISLRRIFMGNKPSPEVLSVIDEFFHKQDDGRAVNSRLEKERNNAKGIYERKVSAAQKVAAARKSPDVIKELLPSNQKITKSKKNELTPSEKKYCFNGRVIKLIETDFNKLKSLFPMIDLNSELNRFDLAFEIEEREGGKKKNWYMELQAKLKYQNDKALKEKQATKEGKRSFKSPRGAI